MNTEIRLRNFYADDKTKDQSGVQPIGSCVQMESVSSSSTYLTESSSLPSMIIEEHWTESALTTVRLLKITSTSFDKHQLCTDPSYGKDVTKLSFEGPASIKCIDKALKTFPVIDTLEFGHQFFTHEKDQELVSSAQMSRMEFSRIKSLTVNYNVSSYFKLKKGFQRSMQWTIGFLLSYLSDSLTSLTYCILSLPDTPLIRSYLNLTGKDFFKRGIKSIDDSKRQIKYQIGSSPSKPSPATTTLTSSFPEVEIIAVISKTDKIILVNLSDDDEIAANYSYDI